MALRPASLASAIVLAGATVLLAAAPERGSATQLAPAAVEPVDRDATEWAKATLARLTLDRKIGQMICEPIEGTYAARDTAQRQNWMSLARDHGVGSFVLYGGTPHDTARLLNELQRASDLPLLIAADFEGGPGQQLTGATEFPGNMALAAIGSTELAYDVGRVGAAEGRAVGIHLTFSPVVDVQTDPANPVLSVRSFGRDLDQLGRLAGAYIRGYQENGMLATAKHYPGRGDVQLIPGTEYTVNRKPPGQIEREDFLAFRHAIEAGVAFVMSEHIAIPSLTDGSDLPASVEPILATEWLRNRLGFTGVLTTDDLWYPKVTERFGAEQAAVMAVQAGHDMVLKPADARKTIAALVEAVRTGVISEDRIDRSVERLLYWKARLGLHRNRLVDLAAIDAVVGSEPHRALLSSIVDQSLTVLVNDGVLPTTPAKLGRLVHVSIQRRQHDAAPLAVDQTLRASLALDASYLIRPDTAPTVRAEAVDAARSADSVVVSLFNPRTVYRDNGPLGDADRQLIEQIIQARPGATIVMSYGNPYVIESFATPAAFVVGYGEGGFYGNQLAYADAFVKLLHGTLSPRGRLPIRLSERFPVGSGARF